MKQSYVVVVCFVGALGMGCTGADGDRGPEGPAGSNGQNGNDGISSLVSTSVEDPGTNCAAGGIRIDVGLDTNESGTLDTDEITETQYVCNGGDGSNGSNGDPGNDGKSSLIATTPLGLDSACVFGGVQIDFGIDDDGDNFLDPEEVDGTERVCAACPFDPTAYSYDFGTMGSSNTALLDLGEVEITGAPGNVNIIANNGLGVLGGNTPQIDQNESLTFTFAGPVYGLTYKSSAIGFDSTRSIEAFGKDGSSLGTITVSGTASQDLTTAFSGAAITKIVDTQTGVGVHNVRNLGFSFCP